MSTKKAARVVVFLPLCSLTLFFLYYHRSYLTTFMSTSSIEQTNPTLRIIREFRLKQASWATKLNVSKPTVKEIVPSSLAANDNGVSFPLLRNSTYIPRVTVSKSLEKSSSSVDSHQPTFEGGSNIDYSVLHPNSKNISCYHDLYGVTINADNVFLYNSVCKVSSESDIINFRGRREYTDMGLDFSNPHIVIHGRNPIKRWADLTTMMKEKQKEKPVNVAVHVHNEIKIGDFFHFILKEHIARNNAIKGAPKLALRKNVVQMSETEMHAAMDLGQPPMVMSNAIDENWGFLSTCIGNKTTCWLNMTNHLLIHNSNYDTVRHFLSSDKIALVLCNSHVDPIIGTHPKVLGLPLGMKARTYVMSKAMKFIRVKFQKTKLLVINNSGWGDRKRVNEMVSAAFNYTVRNTYNANKRGGSEKMQQWIDNRSVPIETDYYSDMIMAKFVLCPSGLGMDTYRLWEIILLGSIPIVESNAGFDRTYSNLPVLMVRNFNEVTPEFLNKVYPCFVKHAALFRYEHLTLTYWREMVVKAIVTGSIDHITEAHSSRNKYCDYLI